MMLGGSAGKLDASFIVLLNSVVMMNAALTC